MKYTEEEIREINLHFWYAGNALPDPNEIIKGDN